MGHEGPAADPHPGPERGPAGLRPRRRGSQRDGPPPAHSRRAAVDTPDRGGAGRRRAGVVVVAVAARDGGPVVGRPALLARVPGADLRRLPAVDPPGGAGGRAGRASGDGARPGADRGGVGGGDGRGAILPGVVRGGGAAGLAGGAGGPGGGASGSALGGPGGRVPGVHGPAAVPGRDGPGAALAAGRDGRLYLYTANLGSAGGGRGEHHPDRRGPDRSGRGVQRPGDADDVLRLRGGLRPLGPALGLGPGGDFAGGRADRLPGQRGPDQRDGAAAPAGRGPGGGRLLPRSGRLADDAAGPGRLRPGAGGLVSAVRRGPAAGPSRPITRRGGQR